MQKIFCLKRNKHVKGKRIFCRRIRCMVATPAASFISIVYMESGHGLVNTFHMVSRERGLLIHAVLGWVITSRSLFMEVITQLCTHYGDVIMGAIASQITSLTVVYWTVYSDADQRKHQSSASLAFVRGIHWSPVNSRTNGQWRKNVPILWRYHVNWMLAQRISVIISFCPCRLSDSLWLTHSGLVAP